MTRPPAGGGPCAVPIPVTGSPPPAPAKPRLPRSAAPGKPLLSPLLRVHPGLAAVSRRHPHSRVARPLPSHHIFCQPRTATTDHVSITDTAKHLRTSRQRREGVDDDPRYSRRDQALPVQLIRDCSPNQHLRHPVDPDCRRLPADAPSPVAQLTIEPSMLPRSWFVDRSKESRCTARAPKSRTLMITAARASRTVRK